MPVRFETIIRIVIMAVAAAVAVVGICVMAGVLVNPAMPGDFRIILGACVFLYGAYRFTVAYFRRPGRREP